MGVNLFRNMIIWLFQIVEKVRIEIKWLRKLAVKIAEEMNNERYIFFLSYYPLIITPWGPYPIRVSLVLV